MKHQMKEIEMIKREGMQGPLLLCDATQTSVPLLIRSIQSGYSGVLLTPNLLEEYRTLLPERITKIIDVTDLATVDITSLPSGDDIVVASRHKETIRALALQGITTAYRAFVDDSESLHDAITSGKEHDYVLMSFKDPTNIPLELVIASLQSSQTILIKEIAREALEDAIVTLGVMEVGADGILFTPQTDQELDTFLARKHQANERTLPLQVGEVVSTKPIGMGYRSCIDLATLFTPTEGMLVGSTSQGGILCCPEVFHLPYMELRPFRVNAGAVHSYVFNLSNRTEYMTELKAGVPVMVVDANGKTRRAYVGRMKTEVRPLRLIEVEFENNYSVNILLQDDWHVRIYSDDAKPLNITELKPGSKVLGHVTEPGRHVGIKVSEQILEI